MQTRNSANPQASAAASAAPTAAPTLQEALAQIRQHGRKVAKIERVDQPQLQAPRPQR